MTNNETIVQNQVNHVIELFAKNKFNEGAELTSELLRNNPQLHTAYYLMGLVFKHYQYWSDAQSWFKQAVLKQNNNFDYWIEYADSLRFQGDYEGALNAFKRAQAIGVYDDIVPLLMIADLYGMLDQHPKRLPYYEKAIKLQPDDYRGQLGMACTLHYLRKTELAEPYYLTALTLVKNTQNSQAIYAVEWEYAMQALLKGDFAQGWQYYDVRLNNPENCNLYSFDLPVWSGENLTDKTILIQAEQGFGDVIMYASILPEIIQQAKKVIIACQPSLVDLFRRSFPDASVETLNPFTMLKDGFVPGWLGKYSTIDYQSAIGSLPRWQRTTLESFPCIGSYLKVDTNKAYEFSQRLKKLNQDNDKKIGLVWQGNMDNGDIGKRKSIPANLLDTLNGIPKAKFISLQLENVEKQLDDIPQLDVIRMGRYFKNLDYTAALISELDLVVCVDTVTAHLAAALGKPVIVMLWFAADWRYLQYAETCYWYPNMKIIRQTVSGDWQPVLDAVKKEVLEFVC